MSGPAVEGATYDGDDLATLRGIALRGIDLRSAVLDWADVTGARLEVTLLDLAGAVRLAEAHGASVQP